MSTDHTNQIDQKIKGLQDTLLSAYKKTVYSRKGSQISLFVGTLVLFFVLIAIVESAFYLPAAYKTGALAVSIILTALITYIFHRKIDWPSRDQFTETFLKSVNKDGEAIQSALDLYQNSSQKSSVFYEAALQSNLRNVHPEKIAKDLEQYVRNHKTVQFASRSIAFLTLAFGIFSIFLITTPDGVSRTATFWQHFEKPNPFNFVVFPGSDTVEQEEIVSPEIEFTGSELPNNVILAYKTDVEDEYRERPMNPSGDSVYRADGIEATSSLSYYVQMDEFKSESYRLDVQVRPRFDNLAVKITPPAYTRLPEKDLEYPYPVLNLYPGSNLKINGHLNKTVAKIQLLSEHNLLTVTGAPSDSLDRFTTEIKPEKKDTLRFQITDHNGLENRNPFNTFLNITEDESPVVVIREPTGTIMQNEPQEIDILYQVTDDFGIEETQLRWEIYRAYVDKPEVNTLQLMSPENGRNTRISWDLSEVELRPRDELRFRIRARDNDAISGGKWGESQEVVIQVPSMAEFFEEIDSKERSVQGELEQVSENFEQMEQEFERFLERLRENPEGGFEEQEMLESVSEQQRDVDETVKQLKEQFEELRRDMDESSNISEETMDSYRELQQLMEDLDDPDLQKALQDLRDAMENMNPNQIEQALKNVSFNEELYKERLERTKELFKKLKMNSDLDKLAQQYEDLSERIQDDPETSLKQLKQEMGTAGDDMDRLSEQLEKLDENPPKRSEEQLRNFKKQTQERLQEINEAMEQLGSDIDNEIQDGSSEPNDQIQQQQQQISQQLQEESDKMKQMRQKMNGEQLQVNLLALQKALYTLFELSETQEYLTKDSEETANRSAEFVNLARRQSYVKNQFSAVADTIFQISSEIPGVPNQVNRKKAQVEQTLERAVEQMSERNQRIASITSRESLGGINGLTSTIASLIDHLMDQQGQGGGAGNMSMQQMIEQMKQMSGDQQQLNQQLQDMVNDMQGDRLGREQSERLDEMARQQNEIRRQLRELQRSGALREGDQGLSELQRMIDEMEDSINDMRGGVTDNLMIERQQNILSRMLNAEEAMERRGEEEEREGSSAEQFDSELPPDMTLEELQQEIRSRLQDPNYTRFSEEHQRLIERYFEMLRRMDDAVIQ